jgi:hypothetical protein
LAACKKWVDIDPPLQANEDVVFAKEEGFRNVLNGVYLQMGDSSLYGRELTFGLLSILGRSYDTINPAIKNVYYQGARYNFQDADVKASFSRIWQGMYQCISNLNYLLANIESRSSVLGNNYNKYKGEALGLRAFLYFDLVRMYAPSPAVDPNGLAVPYITQAGPYAAPVATTSAVIDSCIADLVTAQSLLSTSDVTATHLTNWSIRALLARIYLYKGDLANARQYATDLINSKQFPLVSTNDFLFAKEQLFSLYLPSATSGTFYKSVFNTNPPLGFTPQNQTVLFVNGGGGTLDYRKQFVDPATQSTLTGTIVEPRKCIQTLSNNLPLVRMSEMYYIAAECATAFNDSLTATSLMDSVRVHRGLVKYTQTALKRDSLTVEIGREYQKEFISEGQVFYYYKRRNLPFSALPFTKVLPVAGASYVFIKPE